MASKDNAVNRQDENPVDNGTRKRKREEKELELGKTEDQDINEEDKANKLALKKLRKEKLAIMKEELNRLKAGTSLEDTSNGVYVSNLPQSATKEELTELFKKYGTIAEDITTNEPRIKLYYDSKDQFTGEGLIFYYNSESVDLSIQMLDGMEIQKNKIKVEKASQQHLQQENEKLQLTQDQRKLLQEKKKLLTQKLTDWEDQETPVDVVVENMFRSEEFKQNKSLPAEIKLDIEDECKKLSIFESIESIQFDKTKVIITFNNVTLAQACLKSFNNRYFDGLKLKVVIKP